MWSMFSDGIFLQLVKEISCTSVMELLFLWRCNLFLVYGDSFLICSYQLDFKRSEAASVSRSSTVSKESASDRTDSSIS